MLNPEPEANLLTVFECEFAISIHLKEKCNDRVVGWMNGWMEKSRCQKKLAERCSDEEIPSEKKKTQKTEAAGSS